MASHSASTSTGVSEIPLSRSSESQNGSWEQHNLRFNPSWDTRALHREMGGYPNERIPEMRPRLTGAEGIPTMSQMHAPIGDSPNHGQVIQGLIQALMRVTQAQCCAAKPPERFGEGRKSNVSSWLESVETYLEAKAVPLEEWPKTIETFLSEATLVKVRKARVRDTTRSYEEYKRAICSILGRPEDIESNRVQLDQIRQNRS